MPPFPKCFLMKSLWTKLLSIKFVVSGLDHQATITCFMVCITFSHPKLRITSRVALKVGDAGPGPLLTPKPVTRSDRACCSCWCCHLCFFLEYAGELRTFVLRRKSSNYKNQLPTLEQAHYLLPRTDCYKKTDKLGPPDQGTNVHLNLIRFPSLAPDQQGP